LPINFYDIHFILEDDSFFPTKRGYVLGMANYLFTFISLVIHKMNPNYEESLLVGNDDSCIGFRTEE